MALENTVSMEDSKIQRFTHMEVNRIATVVWAIVKCITISLEDEKDTSIRRYFTPLLKAS